MNRSINIYATSHVVSRADACRHLATSPVVAQAYFELIGCPRLPKDRVDLVDIWRRIWGIDDVPLNMVAAMSEPLLSVDDVARLVNVTPKTIRNAGNSHCRDWNLPAHVDIGPRIRRYLPLHISAWMNRAPAAPWLERRHGAKGPLALSPRRAKSERKEKYDSAANVSENNGKYDEGSYTFGSGNITGLRLSAKNSEQNRK